MGKTGPDLNALKKVGMIQQKQRDYFAMRLHAIGGDFTAAQLKKVADVAERFGRGEVHLTARQGIEIHFVHHSKLEPARRELESAGITMGACGSRVRIITACPGAATCHWGVIDTKEIARDLDQKYFRQDTPYKFKMAVTGCPHNCAKATENDIGIMGGVDPVWDPAACTDCGLCISICPTKAILRKDTEKDVLDAVGYILDRARCLLCSICSVSCPAGAWKAGKQGGLLWLGGTMGKIPRLATRFPELIESKDRLHAMIDRALAIYRRHGRKKERFGHMLDRYGIEQVIEEIRNG
ncbi:MAG: Anaerobic sulfite reductase subunit C [Syntrophaceae bacterium PtaU1.Bin231]|nr:MAG: Anaerobic sulfite reductase subunit C [Syntrophaceae bacterium PtaU1.Bin231]